MNEPAKGPSGLEKLFVERANAVDVEGLVALYEPMLDYCFELERPTCGSVLGGFVISADGEIAMGETDEASMSETWLSAIIRLQRGESSVSSTDVTEETAEFEPR